MEDEFLFVDKDNNRHSHGHIVKRWHEYRNNDDSVPEPQEEIILSSLEELHALLRLAQETYGVWKMENGRILPAETYELDDNDCDSHRRVRVNIKGDEKTKQCVLRVRT